LIKLDTANGKLIFREIEIGNFYEKKWNFIAALKRYLNANEVSKKNIYTSEILYRIFYCYVNLGLHSDANIYYQILQNEYRGSDFANLAKELKANANLSKIS
jgi:outer membrane protein assembly factor BamD (BamD/ComL family)